MGANIDSETKESDHETNIDLKTDGICGSNDNGNNKESDKESPEYGGKELVDEKETNDKRVSSKSEANKDEENLIQTDTENEVGKATVVKEQIEIESVCTINILESESE